MNRKWVLFAGIMLVCIGMITVYKSQKSKATDKILEITNVSYDATREFYESYNTLFEEYWKETTGEEVNVLQSHGGSSTQARSVAEGNEADVVTLSSAHDISFIEKAGLIDLGWQNELENNSSAYTSTIVFLVRKGNEKNIKDWDDLIKSGVEVVTPNPKTSGGACWNFLAGWAYAVNKYNGDEERAEEFINELYGNVKVLDSGARGSTTTFVENKQGDVLIAWENEANLVLAEHPDEYEIVTPSISIEAEPSVTVVDEVAEENKTEEVSSAYLKYLYSDEAQRIAADNYLRPSNQEILEEYNNVFDLNINMANIDDFGGWEEVYEKFFDDGAIFDQIYYQ